MRYLNFYILIIVAVATLMSGCSQTDEPQILTAKFPEDHIVMAVGESYYIKPIFKGVTIPLNELEWLNSNPNVVDVAFGNIYAKNQGESTITIKYKGKELASCGIEVQSIIASNISLSQDSIEIVIGKTFSLEADIYPQNTTNKRIIWSSSNTSVASVNENGVISAIGIGETEILAIIEGYNVSAKCFVRVTPILVENIVGLQDVSILLGQSHSFSISVSPKNATYPDVKWESSNPEIVSVSEVGAIVGKSLGQATLTAHSIDGGNCSTSCKIDVCEIDRFVTISAKAGSEGSSSSGFFSYLSLFFKTNVESPVFIKSILLNDENGNVIGYTEPNLSCTDYSTKFYTKYNGLIIDTFLAEGWTFYVHYIWSNKEYKAIYTIPKGGGWF